MKNISNKILFFCILIPFIFTDTIYKSRSATFKLFKDYKLPDNLLTTVTRRGQHMSKRSCSMDCLRAGWDVCKAVNFQADERLCTLLPVQKNATNPAVPSVGTTYMEPKIALRSCTEWKSVYGSTISGSHMIDPDGPETGLEPFPVYCDFQENPPVAKVYHNKAEVTVNGYIEPASYHTDIDYELPKAQMLSIIEASTNCRQFLKVKCYGSALYEKLQSRHNTYWSSRDGERMLYWGGGDPSGWGCACALDNSCVGGLDCNCNANDFAWREDEGYVTDRTKLPVSQLYAGDTGGPLEVLYISIGPLECVL